ncbi:GD25373 [Drosophila simulans]|uniref:GD25373 n=1 Tax=Drosophila simulans TaxID=7240 RepID=B4QD09_DROSI|nr:GD25373 [Drosophila simulans]
MELRPPAIRCSQLQHPGQQCSILLAGNQAEPWTQPEPSNLPQSQPASQTELLRSKESARRNRSHIADRGVPATPLHKIEE